MKYRKKPIVIEAMRVPEKWDGSDVPLSLGALVVWLGPGDKRWCMADGGGVMIDTPEGSMVARPGDWIIRGVKGELYPCGPDIFAVTYEPVEK